MQQLDSFDEYILSLGNASELTRVQLQKLLIHYGIRTEILSDWELEREFENLKRILELNRRNNLRGSHSRSRSRSRSPARFATNSPALAQFKDSPTRWNNDEPVAFERSPYPLKLLFFKYLIMLCTFLLIIYSVIYGVQMLLSDEIVVCKE